MSAAGLPTWRAAASQENPTCRSAATWIIWEAVSKQGKGVASTESGLGLGNRHAYVLCEHAHSNGPRPAAATSRRRGLLWRMVAIRKAWVHGGAECGGTTRGKA